MGLEGLSGQRPASGERVKWPLNKGTFHSHLLTAFFAGNLVTGR